MSTIAGYFIAPESNAAIRCVIPRAGGESLKALQALVDGYVEVVNSSDDTVSFWINEEGKLRGLPINTLATAFWWAVCPEAVNVDTLRGNVVILGGTDKHGGTLPVSADVDRLIADTVYVDDEDEDYAEDDE
ncbi:MAG: DUF3846 domain-containing protein [Leifsonia sp.]